MIIRSYHRGVPGGLAAPFCRGVGPPLAELKALLAFAEQEGVSGALGQVMDNTVSALRRSVLALRTQIAGESSLEVLLLLTGPIGWAASLFTSTDEAKRAALSGLSTIEAIIRRLDGPSRGEVLAGTMLAEKWAASARVTAEGIQDQLRIFNDNSTIDMLSAQLDQMVADFRALGVQVVSTFNVALPFLLVGGLGLAVFLVPLLLKASPAGRVLRGFRSRRS